MLAEGFKILKTYTVVLHLAKRMRDVLDFTEDFVEDFVLAMQASGETSGASVSSGGSDSFGRVTVSLDVGCLDVFTTDFNDTQPPDKNSREHLAIRFRQSCAPYMVFI